ncbi:MAG: carboxypeptidase-like regulatory domain-containing protein [Reichenbachiella sp.]|uniref:carboxypeptidase-like regulatory domain-containing protein n=1 Tax=Reichenbachiella sp. TaxID=2184521 RepID=UPI003264B9EB
MKKHVIIIILTAFMFGASAYEYVGQILPTSLKVSVLDELGNPVQDAEVSLFDNEEDYRAETNPLAQKVTDKKGVAVFKKLDPVRYYILASFQDKNNIGSGVQTDSLVEGRINKVNTIIE